MTRAVLVLFTAAVLLSACGGDEPSAPAAKATPDAAAQVRTIAAKVLTQAGGYELCFENSTDRFIQSAFKGDRNECGYLQRIIGPGTPHVLGVRVDGDRAFAAVEYQDSAVKGAFGTLELVREGSVWKLDKLDDGFMLSTYVASVQTLSIGALSEPEVQRCVTAQAEKMSNAAVRRYVYAMLRLDDRTGKAAFKLVKKCPRELAIFVADELVKELERDGYSKAYVKCARPRLEYSLAVTGLAPEILAGADDEDGAGVAALSGVMLGVNKFCRRHR